MISSVQIRDLFTLAKARKRGRRGGGGFIIGRQVGSQHKCDILRERSQVQPAAQTVVILDSIMRVARFTKTKLEISLNCSLVLFALIYLTRRAASASKHKVSDLLPRVVWYEHFCEPEQER